MDPENNDTGLMDAINAGISHADTGAPLPTIPDEPTGGTDDAKDTAVDAAGDAGDESAPGSGTDGATPVGDGEPADSATPDVSAEAVKPDAADAADKPDAKATDKAGEKTPDPLNDPLPNALKKETKERIQTLVGMVKENTTKLERVQADHNEMMGMIQETRATPEQYGQALDYLRMVNSGDPAQQEQALAVMQRELNALARMLGKPVPGVNLLEGHDDLIQEVGTGRISAERAAEIAGARERQTFQQRQGQAVQQGQQTAQIHAQARQQLNQLGIRLQRENPTMYAAKRAVLAEALKPVFAQINPAQWAATYERAYNKLQIQPVARPNPTPTVTTPTIPQNTPLRGANPAGGQRAAPKSIAEAIDFGIADASGR